MQNQTEINEVSGILLKALAERPDLLAKISSQQRTGAKPVRRRRLTMAERENMIRERFYARSDKRKAS